MLNVYNEREDPWAFAEMDLEHRVVNTEQLRCIIPWKRCWDSGKRLFMKSCIRVTCAVSGPGDDVRTIYYFEPKRWTIRLIKK